VSEEPQIHPTHDPEPTEGRIYRGGTACRRCGWFVAFDEDGAFPMRITNRGQQICPGPMRISLRGDA
jgi:hypothetical protein